MLLGRGALKEYLWALKKGWGEAIDLRQEGRLEGLGLGANERRKDGRWEREEELMLRELEKEDEARPDGGPFDERAAPTGLESVAGEDDAASSAPGSAQPVSFLAPSPFQSIAMPPPPPPPSSRSLASNESEPPLILPPSEIPPQPPLLLVPFSYPFGIQTWAGKLAHFWNHRRDAKLGGEYALALVTSQTRPFDAPRQRDPASGEVAGLLDDEFVAAIRRGEHHLSTMEKGVSTGSKDLDFLAETDERPEHFKKAYRTLPKGHEYFRRTYYNDELPPKLETARELARGEREPTKAEVNYPPKIESELRKERLDKELRWRRELEGWAIQRAGSGISWRDGWEDKLRVIEVPPSEDRLDELDRGRQEWRDLQQRKEEERERFFAEQDRMRGYDLSREDDEGAARA